RQLHRAARPRRPRPVTAGRSLRPLSLLRQPRGPQGFRPVEVLLRPDDPAVAEGENGGEPPFGIDATPTTSSGPARPSEDTIARCLDVLLGIGMETFKAVEPTLNVAPDALTTPMGGSVWVFPRCLPLNLPIPELRDDQVEVASVERVVCPSHDLDVRLRHG